MSCDCPPQRKPDPATSADCRWSGVSSWNIMRRAAQIIDRPEQIPPRLPSVNGALNSAWNVWSLPRTVP